MTNAVEAGRSLRSQSACTMGQQGYTELRTQLLAQPGALACKVNQDCALLGGNAYCGDPCSQIAVNAAAASLPPSCVQGQCESVMFAAAELPPLATHRVACRSDSDCSAGPNGRCFPFEGLVGPGGCSYDECAADSDCASGRPCVCRSTPSDNDANVCAPLGDCAVDADCGAGGYCSPSAASCDFPHPYFCHTALDTCTNDADCSLMNAVDPAATRAVCAYDPQALRWACTQLVCYPP